MEYRLPYYMAYPMPLQYDDDRVSRRDFEYMKSMYPMAVKRILPYVEEECERMSYDGSMIYDEYPDQLQMHMMCKRIYDQIKKTNPRDELFENSEWLKYLIQVMVFQELFQRRNQYRRNRRKLY